MNNHVRREHQLSVKVKFQGGSATEVKRGADGMFKCECGKSFKLPSSVHRHAKGCSGEAMESCEDEGEDVQMSRESSDASECPEYGDEEEVNETSIDCFGALFSHEMG